MATAAASSGDDLRKELTCAICLDFYTDPVILKCGHNFCRFCICMHWDENGGDYGYQCPQCRTVFNKRTFTKNYLVQNLVAKMDDLECLGSVASPAGPLKMDGECRLHGEELKLYCQTDKEAICVVCRESRVHRHHEVAPVSEVAHDMKVELHLRLMDLNRHRSQCLRVIAADERTKNEVRMKKQRLKDKVEADVGALVQFLLDERDSLLDSLDAEEAAAVAALDDNLDAVKAEAAAAERRLADVRAHVGGETTFQSLAETFNEVVHGKPFPEVEPEDSPTEFTDFSGPFQLIMWKKMMHVLHTMPQNLTLDPDTAHPNLLISDYDTKVEEVRSRNPQEPDLPDRFTRFCGVLATAQYCGGQHYWEVDVRDKGVWYLGVTAQGSKRKGFVSLTPAAGYWSLCLQDRLYANGVDGRVPVADYWNSPRVGVYLDYDRGLLSFYDAVTMKLLYVFDTCFHRPVYPFFSPGKNDPGSRLRICHYY
ncbi:E3 ubiquitin-protein ligase TRIM47 isoform X2 [Corythoichthys intestinalis]|uniref:E3 ubiquitin-protein ligase TRIM47 isoform X2 n=1 Tax=Corythoichthys intestinalis TaxID=161448 RepID=UPI0025A5856A|nr:E3 ubiquitin-protein ligase TRIM47 isoform X2 [Corythoichthys intestinalis]XP_061801871.1 zinc-binding protein A33-like [Nerophis lumbriciformis]